MSDGVWKYAGWENILKSAAVQHGADLLESVRRQATLKIGGNFQDDFTLVVLEDNGS